MTAQLLSGGHAGFSFLCKLHLGSAVTSRTKTHVKQEYLHTKNTVHINIKVKVLK